MDTFPTLPIDAGSSKVTERDGRDELARSDGIMDVLITHESKFDFDLKFPGLTSAQLSTLQTFYTDHRAAVFNFVYLGTTYVVQFGSGGLQKQWVSAAATHAWLRMVAAA